MGCAGSIVRKTQVAAADSNGDEKKALVPPTIVSQMSRESSGKSALTQNIIKANQDKDIRDYYEIDHQPILGSGISGQVKICIHKSTQMQYALKSLSKRALPKEKLNRMKDEIRCMAYLDHPNILRVHEFFENKDVIYLILELCRGGELLDRLHQQQGHHYSEKVACKYVHTMLTAISYCHANNVVHRDLKLENFLFESDSPDSDLKLIDFGLSQYFKPKEMMHNSVGTPYYVAPEVLEGNYDAKCDVWSIGVIAFMLLSGTPPFYGRSDAETLNAVRLGRWQFDEYLFKHISADAKDFITKCLIRRPNARPTAKAALEHKWFAILHSNQGTDHQNVSLQIVKRLDNYIKRSSLAKIIMDVVAHTLVADQIADLREQFMKFDVSHSGEISLADLRSVLSRIPGFREEDLNQIFTNLDIDQTGTISYHEFLAATVSRQNIKEENLQIAFERMSNRNGSITSTDIKTLLGDAKYDVDKIMEEVGLTTDSSIGFNEFKTIMYGGTAVPITESPYRLEMRKAAFWKDGDMSGNNTPNPNSRSERNAVFQAAYSQKASSLPGALAGNGPSQAIPIMSSPGETSARKQYTTPTSVNYSALHTPSAPAPLTLTNPTAVTVPTGVRAAEGIEQVAGSLEEMDLLD